MLRPSAGSMSSGSVIGVTSTVGVSTALPVGRTSIASEEDCPPETYSLVNSIGQCSSDQSPMVKTQIFYLCIYYIYYMYYICITYNICNIYIRISFAT